MDELAIAEVLERAADLIVVDGWMTASLRSHIADVLERADPDGEVSTDVMADVLLADPTLAAIIDLAASHYLANGSVRITPETRALLVDWRANR